MSNVIVIIVPSCHEHIIAEKLKPYLLSSPTSSTSKLKKLFPSEFITEIDYII
jgi:hypothetical protein